MHREKLRSLLNAYEPNDPKEIEAKKFMIAFLNEHSNCFERFLEKGHFTGSSWIVNYDNSEFLLTHHKKLNMWLQLGGHADGDSDLMNVAMKEAYEESGLQKLEFINSDIFDISVHEIPEHKGVPKHYHLDVRFLIKSADPKNLITISNESNDLKWFQEPPTDHFEIRRMFEKWKKMR